MSISEPLAAALKALKKEHKLALNNHSTKTDLEGAEMEAIHLTGQLILLGESILAQINSYSPDNSTAMKLARRRHQEEIVAAINTRQLPCKRFKKALAEEKKRLAKS